jgi:hypothetical protein
MPVEAVDQDTVLEHPLHLVKGARKRIWITSPWITQRAVNLLLRDVLPKCLRAAASGERSYVLGPPARTGGLESDYFERFLQRFRRAGAAARSSITLSLVLPFPRDSFRP